MPIFSGKLLYSPKEGRISVIKQGEESASQRTGLFFKETRDVHTLGTLANERGRSCVIILIEKRQEKSNENFFEGLGSSICGRSWF